MIAKSIPLKLVTVRDARGTEATFLANRHPHLNLQAGDTRVADATIALTLEESALVQAVGRLAVTADGSPDDLFARIIEKAFDAGRQSLK